MINTFGFRTEQIDLDEFISYRDNPIQRNTELRAKKASKAHLRVYDPTHRKVSVARLPNGVVYKLDGHTRAYLWERNLLNCPHGLSVDVYEVESVDDAIELYKRFDSSFAVETSRDKLSGAFSHYDFDPTSSLIKQGGITSAINILDDNIFRLGEIYQSVKPWIKPLEIIDDQNFAYQKGLFPTGVICALLLTTLIDGENAMGFWRSYAHQEGVKNKDGRDAVQALADLVFLMKAKGQISGGSNIVELCEKAISAYERNKLSVPYTNGIKRTSIKNYIEAAKRAFIKESAK